MIECTETTTLPLAKELAELDALRDWKKVCAQWNGDYYATRECRELTLRLGAAFFQNHGLQLQAPNVPGRNHDYPHLSFRYNELSRRYPHH